MNPIFRLVLAVVIGIVIAIMVIVLVDTLNAHLYPSVILHPTIKQQEEIIKHSPLSEFLLVLLGYILSAFFGGYAAARLAPSDKKTISALTVGFFLVLGGIINFVVFPQPLWLAICSGLSYMLFSFLGAKAAIR